MMIYGTEAEPSLHRNSLRKGNFSEYIKLLMGYFGVYNINRLT